MGTTSRVLFERFSPTADLTVVAVCIVMVILMLFAYVRRERTLRIFLGTVGMIVFSACVDVSWNMLIRLGDPSLYSSFGYIQHYLEADGYRTAMVPGVPSFCAAAARLNVPLVQWDAPLHVLPAAHETCADLDLPGACVLMKPAGRMQAIKDALRASGRGAMMVENCGMAGERVYRNAEELPDEAGYFSLIIAGPTAQHE